jgi:hypothetical protein
MILSQRNQAMKKTISKLCCLSILMTSLVSTGVPAAFAQDLQGVEVAQSSKFSQIQSALAEYSVASETGSSKLKAITEITLKLQNAGITSDDMLGFASADLSKAEAESMRLKIAEMKASNGSIELSDLLASIVSSKASGSNFLGCGMVWTLGIGGALTFIIAGALALGENEEGVNKKKKYIQALEMQRVDMVGDINVLISEGVNPNGYLITSRKADLAYLDASIAQETNDKEESKKKVQLYGIIAGVGGAATLLAMLDGSDC